MNTDDALGGIVVALRKESVDRNTTARPDALVSLVALRKESVDRNNVMLDPAITVSSVALRKESVDRNVVEGVLGAGCPGSLSARRAWIEIAFVREVSAFWRVALRKESVDRNSFQSFHWILPSGRSPQGERG